MSSTGMRHDRDPLVTLPAPNTPLFELDPHLEPLFSGCARSYDPLF